MKQRALSIQLKLLKIWKQWQIVEKFHRTVFRTFYKLLNFRNANHSTKNSRNSESKVEWKENFQEKVSENLVIPRHVVLFLNILKNVVPFSTASCRKFKPDFLVEWKARKFSSQIQAINSVLTESSSTAWQSRNGNENFLTWNGQFRSNQTNRSNRTTLSTGSPMKYFIYFHTFSYKFKVQRTPTEFGQPVL